jgi:hypothetical protein
MEDGYCEVAACSKGYDANTQLSSGSNQLWLQERILQECCYRKYEYELHSFPASVDQEVPDCTNVTLFDPESDIDDV